jgi:hypothetical protein
MQPVRKDWDGTFRPVSGLSYSNVAKCCEFTGRIIKQGA